MMIRALLAFVFVVMIIDHASAHTFAVPPGASTWKRTIIAEWRARFGLESDVSLPFAQVHQESRFNPNARSKYASGLAQFTPGTATDFQRNVSALREFCSDAGGCPLEPRWAIRALVAYDFGLWRKYAWAMSADDRWAFVLAGYNGGAGWITRERREATARGREPRQWFGSVETVCLRAEWACKENREYPRIILLVWRPNYRAWLAR